MRHHLEKSLEFLFCIILGGEELSFLLCVRCVQLPADLTTTFPCNHLRILKELVFFCLGLRNSRLSYPSSVLRVISRIHLLGVLCVRGITVLCHFSCTNPHYQSSRTRLFAINSSFFLLPKNQITHLRKFLSGFLLLLLVGVD